MSSSKQVTSDVIWKEIYEQLPEDVYTRFSDKEVFAMVYEAVQVNIIFTYCLSNVNC